MATDFESVRFDSSKFGDIFDPMVVVGAPGGASRLGLGHPVLNTPPLALADPAATQHQLFVERLLFKCEAVLLLSPTAVSSTVLRTGSLPITTLL